MLRKKDSIEFLHGGKELKEPMMMLDLLTLRLLRQRVMGRIFQRRHEFMFTLLIAAVYCIVISPIKKLKENAL